VRGQKQNLRVAVIGGSIGGLSTGIALHCVGCDVYVFERSPHLLRGRGGGLVVQYEMLDWMAAHGIAALATLSIPGVERQFLDRDGNVIRAFPDSTPFTSWDAVFHQLRTAFPDERYEHGRECVAITQTRNDVQVLFADGSKFEADLVIGADGLGSAVRRQLFPSVVPKYAGYVAWRGVYSEKYAPREVVERLAQRFTMYQGDDFHLLTYLIPGANGELAPGERRMNWVWYWNTNDDELRDVLTGEDGRKHRASLPPGMLQKQHRDMLHRRAERHLPLLLAQLVRSTPEPFVQAIFDLRSASMCDSRVALIGDSACVVRPHTASGTSKASGDAVSLAQHLQAADFDVSEALRHWEPERLAVAARLVAYGRRLAVSSGLGR
jgi:2-polyprenyl-6-methoxyphenol hydroxylase-like FAD-dependent oxidoreductase